MAALCKKGVIYIEPAIEKTAAHPINRRAAAVFPQQKSTESVLADPCVLPHLSSSPDSRLVSNHTAFSGYPNGWLSPMN